MYHPPATEIVYQVSEAIGQGAISAARKMEEISVQPFGLADPNLGQSKPNTRIHFYDHFKEVKNAQILEMRNVGYNYSSLNMGNGASVTVGFDLQEDQLVPTLGLYLTHLSSDLHRGKFYDAPIRIFINDTLFKNKYVPASHDWIWDDYLDLSELVESGVLQVGSNTVTIELHKRAWSCYWLHSIKIKN